MYVSGLFNIFANNSQFSRLIFSDFPQDQILARVIQQVLFCVAYLFKNSMSKARKTEDINIHDPPIWMHIA